MQVFTVLTVHTCNFYLCSRNAISVALCTHNWIFWAFCLMVQLEKYSMSIDYLSNKHKGNDML